MPLQKLPILLQGSHANPSLIAVLSVSSTISARCSRHSSASWPFSSSRKTKFLLARWVRESKGPNRVCRAGTWLCNKISASCKELASFICSNNSARIKRRESKWGWSSSTRFFSPAIALRTLLIASLTLSPWQAQSTEQRNCQSSKSLFCTTSAMFDMLISVSGWSSPKTRRRTSSTSLCISSASRHLPCLERTVARLFMLVTVSVSEWSSPTTRRRTSSTSLCIFSAFSHLPWW